MNHNPTVENPLGVKPVKGLIWKFAIPGIISQLVNSLHNIVDQMFIGWGIGDLGIAATNIVFPLAALITALSALIGMGGVSRFSINLGEKKPEEAAVVFGNAITLMLFFGVLFAVITSVFLEPMLYLFGSTDAMIPYAAPYARIICLGIPFGIFSVGMSYFIRADGNPNYSSIVLLSGAIFNMIFDPIFLFGFDMGMAGVALATTLGQVLSTILALHYLLRKYKAVTLKRHNFKVQTRVVLSIFALGSSIFTTHILAIIAQIIQMNSLRIYGGLSIYGSEVVIASSGAIAKLSIVFLSSIIGIAIGCQPILGFNLGSKKYDRVKETYLLALRYGTTVASVAFLILQLFPSQLLSIFGSDNPLFYEFATRYIRIYMAVLFLNALQPVTSTFCTAIGKANLGFWMAVIRQGLLMIPLLLILPNFFGLDGVLLAGSISDGIAAMVVIYIGTRQIKRLTALQAEKEK